jgi:hypothetical protein
MLVPLSNVVMHPPRKVPRQNSIRSRLGQRPLRAGQRHINSPPVRIAYSQHQRHLRRPFIPLIGKTNPDSENTGERLPVRKNLSQNSGTKCLCLSRFDMAFEQGKSDNHEVGPLVLNKE